MKQVFFSQAKQQSKKKMTRCKRFLAQVEALVPWQRLIVVQPPTYFPNSAGKRGRPPISMERMLGIYFLQQLYTFADEADGDTGRFQGVGQPDGG